MFAKCCLMPNNIVKLPSRDPSWHAAPRPPMTWAECALFLVCCALSACASIGVGLALGVFLEWL